MKVLGIVAEYNPFHTGHAYLIEEARRLYHPDVVIAVMSGTFTQRGEPAILSKWTRARIAVQNGADVVFELPLVPAVESADYFAQGGVRLLHAAGVTDLCFGAETDDTALFVTLTKAVMNDQSTYDSYVREYMKGGLRYADATNKALSQLTGHDVTKPNDLLAFSYVKVIVQNEYDITPHAILRQGDFHSDSLGDFASASALRKALTKGKDVSQYLPGYDTYKDEKLVTFDDFFEYLRYRCLILNENEPLHMNDEGLGKLLLKHIDDATSMDDLVERMTSRRYTRGRIRRFLTHVLLNTTEDEARAAMHPDYLRVLAFSKTGQAYLHDLRETSSLPVLTRVTMHDHPALLLERRAASLRHLIDGSSATDEYAKIPWHE